MHAPATCRRILALVSILGFACSLARAQSGGAQAASAAQSAAPAQNSSGLLIENDSPLPDAFPRAPYEFRFQARRGERPLRWKLDKGAIPPGMKLEDDGLLHGQAERAGEFQFTVSVTDSNQPPESVQKSFVLRVRSALSLTWKSLAHVNGNRIEGSAEVSNATGDDIDLTFIVMAVASNGRATAIGYQHFVLRRGTQSMVLPFGDTLPSGAYVVHVDAVGEVAARNLIYRERLQTPSALNVLVGP